MLITNSFRFAYQSPRVSGNAVYQARAMLGLYILDTETYSAKSAQNSDLNSRETENYLKLYPNPAREQIEYEFEIKNEQVGKVTVFSILGSTLIEFQVNHKISKGSIDLTKFSKGVYLFELNVEGNQKIIKQFIVD
jgi:hypothetical protein